jgi:autotransporter-associated beta strand protein
MSRIVQSSFNLLRSNRAGYTKSRGTGGSSPGVPRSTTLNWNGAGGDDNWSTSLNWGGNTPINGDSLVFSGGSRLTPVNNVSSLTLMSIAFTSGSVFSVSGNQVSLSNGALSSTSPVQQTIANALAITGALSVSTSSSQAFNITGVISGSGSIVKSGTGSTQFGVDAAGTTGTYSGGTTITAGTLRMAQQCNNVLGAGAITINGATAILSMNRIDLANAVVIGASGGRIHTDNGFGCSVSGTVALNGPCVLDTQFNCTYSNVISGTGSLTQLNTSTATLSATTNTYSGATIITAGTLKITGTASSTPSYAISSGAVLEFSLAADSAYSANQAFTGTGTLRKTGTAALIWGSSVLSMGLGSGALIDVVAGSFVGGSFANDSWTGNLSDLTVASGASFSSVEANVLVNKISGAGGISTGYPGAGYVELTIGVDNGTGATFSGPISDSSGTGNIRKVGTGTQTLSGTSTYTGYTNVHGGVLSVTGTLSASSAVSVNGGGLQGTGTVGAVTVSNTAGSSIAGGTGAAGTLTTGTLTFSGSTAKLKVNTNGSTTVSVVAATTVTLGSVTVDFNTGLNLNAGTYNVITGSSMSGTATQGTLPPGRSWTSLTVVANNLVAVLA